MDARHVRDPGNHSPVCIAMEGIIIYNGRERTEFKMKRIISLLASAVLLALVLLCTAACAEEKDKIELEDGKNRLTLWIEEYGYGEDHKTYRVTVGGYDVKQAVWNGAISPDRLPFTISIAWNLNDKLTGNTYYVSADPVTAVLFENKDKSDIREPKYIIITPRGWTAGTGHFYSIAENRFRKWTELVEEEATPSPPPVDYKEAVDPREHPEALGTVGEFVTFGRYPQTEAGTDMTPVEWEVVNVADGKALLVSRYGLDARVYHKPGFSEKKEITWEGSQLRAWLNSDFLDTAFTPEEQAAILLTSVDNSHAQGSKKLMVNGGNSTEDRLFLLSCAEAMKYYGASWDQQDVRARVAPTPYAYAQAHSPQATIQVKTNDKTGTGEEAGSWWLRSPGKDQTFAMYILSNGKLNYQETTFTYYIRPAFWIDLGSGLF